MVFSLWFLPIGLYVGYKTASSITADFKEKRMDLIFSTPMSRQQYLLEKFASMAVYAVLFVLIGLEIVILTLNMQYVLAGILMIPLVLFARLFSVGIPVTILRLKRSFSPNVVKILTWGGLRGGISVALALSLPQGDYRDIILAMTYIIVVFSILVQGLTIKKLVM